MDMTRDNDRKRKDYPYMERSRDNDQRRCVNIKRIAAANFFFNFHTQKKLLLPAISILSRLPMAYNLTASLDDLTCTDYVDFGRSQDRFGQFSWSKSDSNYLDVKIKVSRKMATKSSEWLQILQWESHTSTSLCN